MSLEQENLRRLRLMKAASDQLESAINMLEDAGGLEEILLLLRTAENNLEDEVVELEKKLEEV